MPQPPGVSGAHEAYLKVLARSEARIEAELNAIRDDVLKGRRIKRLNAMLRSVRAETETILLGTDDWLATTVPEVYAQGALDTGLVQGQFAWTQIHRAAAQKMIDLQRDAILEATNHMTDDVKRWWRDASRAVDEKVIIEGLPAKQAGRELARAFPRSFGPDGANPVTAIVYSNGARHSIDEYGGMLARTTTATAYNQGALNTMDEHEVEWLEVFDGADCGWTEHRDPDKANGTIRTVEAAKDHVIAHPNCRRAFGPRPDITTPTEAGNADPFQDPAVAARAAATERAAAAAETGPARRPGRTPRTPRTGRKPRTPRSTARPESTLPVTPDNYQSTEQAYTVNGEYTPERSALHGQIIAGVTRGIPKSARPKYHMTGGGPASGKSTMIDANPGGRFAADGTAVKIDADMMKEQLPEYNDLIAQKDPRAAMFAHEESSMLTKRTITESLDNGQDVLYDSVGDGGVDKLGRKIDAAHEAGFDVVADYATNDVDLALRLSDARGKKRGRVVPPKVLIQAHADVTDTFVDAVHLGKFDEATLWDTNIKDVPREVLRFDGDHVVIIDQDLFEDFVAKGSRPLDEVVGLLPIQ